MTAPHPRGLCTTCCATPILRCAMRAILSPRIHSVCCAPCTLSLTRSLLLCRGLCCLHVKSILWKPPITLLLPLCYFALGAFYSLPLFCQSCERVIVKRRRTILALTHSIYSWEPSDLESAAAKIPERSIFNRLFGQYLDIEAANPAKSVLVQLFFHYRRPQSDRLLARETYYESRRATPFLHFRQSFSS